MSILIFIFGTLIGSFLNCVIYRLEEGEEFIKGRSYCPHCKETIGSFDLIPIISFLLLKGRCRKCKKKISIQYPLVELFTGSLFLLFFLLYANPIFGIFDFLYYFFILSLMVIVFVYDFKHYLIPNEVTFSAIGATVIWHVAISVFKHDITIIYPFIFSALGAGAFFLSIFLISKGRWMGFGDVKLVFFMGLFLGMPKILTALFISFMSGAIIGSVAVIAKKKGIKSEIPFGPFLMSGTIIAFFWGESILNWYLNFLSINVFHL